MKKLTLKERGEVVTKGYLSEQNFVTKEYLDKQNFVTKEYLDKQHFVTQEYLDNKLEPYVTKDYLDKKLKEQSTEFRQHIDTLIEHQLDQIQIFMEQMDERYVLRREFV